MADSTEPVPERSAHDTRSQTLFGGVYGSVLASAMVAALIQYGHTTRESRLYDATWLLVTGFASALAHGYAHYIAERGPRPRREALRVLVREWPLVVAVLPTVLILAGAGWGWWPARNIEFAVFSFNIALLFALGLVTARWAGRAWAVAVATGVGDALLGAVVVVANAFIE
ncbi:hypothetical protein [Streptomyces sp. NPDC007905]|uniref:hypothetical protein n=1 Tax=Streptomyces sp. NPDC007905 TaxID=3364788 RepID=UPI0036EC8535